MSFASNAANTTLRMINKYGRNVTFTRIVAPGVYDATTSKISDPSTVSTTIKALPQDFAGKVAGAYNNVLVQGGDKILFVAAKSLAKPGIADWFTIGGVKYTIVPVTDRGLGVLTDEAQGVDILYTIHGRRS